MESELQTLSRNIGLHTKKKKSPSALPCGTPIDIRGSFDE